MLYVVVILLFPLLFLLGTGAVRVLYGKKGRSDLFWEDQILAGIMVLIGLAEGAHLAALASGQSILDFKKYFLAFLGAAMLGSIVVLVLERVLAKKKASGASRDVSRKPAAFGKKEKVLFGTFLVIVLCQMLQVLLRTEIYQGRDVTLETVLSFLTSGKLYEINPITGTPYEMGLPSRLKILCLPTLYAALSSLPGVSAEQAVWHFVPTVVLVLAYLAYASLGRLLFPEEPFKRILFLALAALVISVGDYAYGMEGFGLLHCGYQGATIWGAVLLPYLFGLCLRRKWKLAICAAIAESCIVWTLYGLGMGVLMIMICLAWFGAAKLRHNGKEGS